MLSPAQIEALEGLPGRHRRRFEQLTNNLSVRDRAGTVRAWEAVMDGAGKGGEKALESVAARTPVVQRPTGVSVRF